MSLTLYDSFSHNTLNYVISLTVFDYRKVTLRGYKIKFCDIKNLKYMFDLYNKIIIKYTIILNLYFKKVTLCKK